MKKFLFSFVGVMALVSLIAPIQGGEARTKAYYSGDALSYDGSVVITTTNTGPMEIFTLNDSGDLHKFVSFKSYDQRFGKEVNFQDSMLNIESGKLYAYAVDGKFLIKYDISDLKTAKEVARAEDTSWDWYGRLEKVGGYVATIGSKAVKLWTANLKVMDQYYVTAPGTSGVNSMAGESDRFIFTIADDKIKIFDRDTRNFLSQIPLSFKWGGESFQRAVYNDLAENKFYVVDDEAIRRINFSGEIEKSFYHTGSRGYDVAPSSDREFVYFSDGIGIVKLRTSDLKVVDYVYTQGIGSGEGWAMGLKVVGEGSDEKVILFNNSGIVVFDSNLDSIKNSKKELTIATTREEETYPMVSEAVFLTVDKNRAPANATVMVRGGGFGQDETLDVEFGENNKTIVQTNTLGQFSALLTVPSVKKQGLDIKVSGRQSGIHYNLGFQVE